MALVEHLRELRNRLGVSLLALAVCIVIARVRERAMRRRRELDPDAQALDVLGDDETSRV